MPPRIPQQPNKPSIFQNPDVTFQPAVSKGMQRGINQIVNAIRPTLGPLPRSTVNEKIQHEKTPELLDDGGTIARRIVMIKGRNEDVGAMFLRQMLWTLHENNGDGSATAAVLFQAIFNKGLKYIAAGGNAMRLRTHLENTTPLIWNELDRMTIQLDSREQYTNLAQTICYDPPLAKMMGEIFDIIGEHGLLEIRSGRSLELERDYIEGMYWEANIYSRQMITDLADGRVQLEDASILISDLDVNEPQDLLPVLEVATKAGIKNLHLVVRTLSDRALSLLFYKPNLEKIHVTASHTPGLDMIAQRESMEDISILTGGRVFHREAGDLFSSLKAEDFGRARRIWANPTHFGILGGKGSPRVLREHIANLRAAYQNTEDSDFRKRLQKRIGKLIGGAAALYVGAPTPLQVETRKALAERTSEAMRGALREGVVPGGGMSLLVCQKIFEKKLRHLQDPDERAAYNIIIEALAEPFSVLAENAGQDAGHLLSQISAKGPGHGYDFLLGKVVNMHEAGIVDAADVVKSAVFRAIHSAAMALTVDVIVHRKNPPEMYANP